MAGDFELFHSRVIQHGAGEEMPVFIRREKEETNEWHYNLRWRATNDLVPYEI